MARVTRVLGVGETGVCSVLGLPEDALHPGADGAELWGGRTVTRYRIGFKLEEYKAVNTRFRVQRR